MSNKPSKAYAKFCKWVSFRKDCDIIVDANSDDKKAIEEDVLCDRNLHVYFCNILSNNYILFESEESRQGTYTGYKTVYSDGDYETYYGSDGIETGRFRPALGADSKTITTTEHYTYSVTMSIKAIAVPRGEGKKLVEDLQYLAANRAKYENAATHKAEANKSGLTMQQYSDQIKKQVETQKVKNKKRERISLTLFALFVLIGIIGSIISVQHSSFFEVVLLETYEINTLSYVPIICAAINLVIFIVLLVVGYTEEKLTALAFEVWLLFYSLAIILYSNSINEILFNIAYTFSFYVVIALTILGIVMFIRDLSFRKREKVKSSETEYKKEYNALEAEKFYMTGSDKQYEQVLTRCNSINSI